MTDIASTLSLARGLCLLSALICLPACSKLEDSTFALTGLNEETDTGDEGGDGDPEMVPECSLECGAGECVMIGPDAYCECPEGTAWEPYACGECPPITAVVHDIELTYVDFSGEYLLGDGAPPVIEYDDANIWLENARTGDRVRVGNTHELAFSVRVTPGIYDLIYEVESPGARMPHNPRVSLGKIALFASLARDIEIPVARVSGEIMLDGEVPPQQEYDDGNVFLRDRESGAEVLLGDTGELGFAVNVVPADYDIVYRVESPGPKVPRNDGAVLGTLSAGAGAVSLTVDIETVPLAGEFLIGSQTPPATEYNDGNVWLESGDGGRVYVGNTHDLSYDLRVIPGTYDLVYVHESGVDVPQNQHAVFAAQRSAVSLTQIDVPMVALSGTINLDGASPPQDEFDDGVVYLASAADGSDDVAVLGNTHDGAYQVNVIPGSYAVYYALETAGGTVPENKRARIGEGLSFDADTSHDIDITTVSVTGALTIDGAQPPSSVYEDGRIYLRNATSEDSILLGSTHEGSYAAVVVPGEYDVFYTQEVGGQVPSNQNAMLRSESIQASVVLDLDVASIDLEGRVLVDGAPAPNSPANGGQLYLRSVDGDSVLLGDSFAPSYAAKLVAGVYGVYYRSQASVDMPQNDNGRFACITVAQ